MYGKDSKLDSIYDEIKSRENMGDAWENLLFVSSLINLYMYIYISA